MPITIDPETEIALRSQASARGLNVSEYLRTLVLPAGASGSRSPSREESLQAWEDFCTPIEGLPAHPGETFSRETIYSDHD